ncbi:MAG TPA: amidohydrolase family protein [Armatimonadota bacterium]|nr:amidohydrolase family protein [Armatimonadota bacterium]
MRAVDFHTHLGGSPRPGYQDTPQNLLEWLGEYGVDGALISPLNSLYSGCTDHRPENDAIFEYCSQAPGRLFGALCVNPLIGNPALDEIRRCKDTYNAKVLKLHPWLQGFSITSQEMDKVAELCQELGIAILFHDGTPMYTHPLQCARLCRDFPKLTVIAGHTGLGDLWREAMLAAQRYSNFILCLCGPREAAMREIVESVPAKQLCVGSDIFTAERNDPVMWFRWASFRSVEMDQETRRVIETETALKILGR